jgi:geranylgeranyl diphosphate synthase type II
MEALIANYKDIIVKGVNQLSSYAEPNGLYQPIHYLMSLGGKRIRPAVVLMATELYDQDPNEVVSAAIALEVFHNFTLMHDDIMDKAPLRRGKVTVHEKWDLNTAILSGDGMMIIANKLLESVEDKYYKQVMQLFNQTALEVCEGQQFDMDFECRSDVKHEEYIDMIRLKTSVLLACCFQMGALLGGANKADQEHLYHFGELLGIAFQLKDDWLDVFGDSEKVGKQAGGDILANKKTYLLIRALEKSGKTQLETLNNWLKIGDKAAEKVAAVTTLFYDLEIDQDTEIQIDKYYQKALGHLQDINLSNEKKEMLRSFAATLMGRTH